MQNYHWSQTINVKLECSLKYVQSIFHTNYQYHSTPSSWHLSQSQPLEGKMEKLINICRRASVHFKKSNHPFRSYLPAEEGLDLRWQWGRGGGGIWMLSVAVCIHSNQIWRMHSLRAYSWQWPLWELGEKKRKLVKQGKRAFYLGHAAVNSILASGGSGCFRGIC